MGYLERVARDLGDRSKAWVAEGFGPGPDPGERFQNRRSGGGQSSPVDPERYGPEGTIGPLTYCDDADPDAALRRGLRAAKGRRLFYGVHGSQFLFSDADSHVVILGPARKGKTSGVLIPMVLCASGPTVSLSVRPDVLRACAMTKARQGRQWHMNLDSGVAAEGTTQLRYSPISANYTAASTMAKAMCGASTAHGQTGGGNSEYFNTQAARLVGPTLMAAGLGGTNMEWVVNIVMTQDAEIYGAALDVLREHPEAPGIRSAIRDLDGILTMPTGHGSAADILASAARAMAIYNRPEILALTENPNFVPAEFVAGDPDAINPGLFNVLDQRMATQHAAAPSATIAANLPRGYADTIYITASQRTQADVGPLVVGLLQALYTAQTDQHNADDAADYYDRPPMTWALDEVASMAPWKDFPTVVATAGGDGILIGAVFHDLSQIRSKWDQYAPGVIRTNMQTTVVLPGIQDDKTLHDLQETLGYHFVPVMSESSNESSGTSGGLLTGSGQSSAGTGYSVSKHWLPILDGGSIRRGHPDDPSAVLMLGPGLGPQDFLWAHPSPYFWAKPWPELLVHSIEATFNGTQPGDLRRLLPIPSLGRDDGAALYAYRTPEEVKFILDWLAWAKAAQVRERAFNARTNDARGTTTDDTEQVG